MALFSDIISLVLPFVNTFFEIFSTFFNFSLKIIEKMLPIGYNYSILITFLEVFMHRIKELREGRGLTIRGLAQASHITPSTLSRAEAGDRKVSVELSTRLSAFFGVSVDYLLGASPAEMYEKLVKSLKDFYDDTVSADGGVVRALSAEVQEPLRSKLELLFLIDSISSPESLRLLLDLARLRSAHDDFGGGV
ncbi:MAG: helix-turn-helix transcriptional regulator [Prevotella sp.]|nr:helix-turn-helix transcriptional regulator [Prevotella sp.]